MTDREAIEALAASAKNRLAADLGAEFADWLRDWPSEATRTVSPTGLPVLRHLRNSPELLRLEWRRTYTADEMEAAFLENYGWAELIGNRGPFACRTLLCGFLLLGPDTLYRRHRHAAEELYLPLSGTAQWWRDDGQWRTVPPGAVLHHPPWMPHATRTTAEPLLAMYLWRGEGLDVKSELL